MLKPMQVQYLVGLCCLKAHADAVDLVLGDLVVDSSAESKRDVDITVVLRDANGDTSAFKGYEVKDESSPLDISQVEQLCMKYIDMPAVTHRAIVSASGYTAPAVRKAASHNVDLYIFEEWTPDGSTDSGHHFSIEGSPAVTWRFSQVLLVWSPCSYVHLELVDSVDCFRLDSTTPILQANGGTHYEYKTAHDYRDELKLRSTKVLFSLPPASQYLAGDFASEPFANSQAWKQAHTMDVSQDNVHLLVENSLVRAQTATITGEMQWNKTVYSPQFHVLKRLSDGDVFAARAITLGTRPGRMYTLTISPGSPEVSVGQHMLTPVQMNSLRRLKLR
jgi:hypothetical protein